MSHARIGKITLKASGTEVRVFRNPLPDHGENWRGTIIEHARIMAADQDELVGFVMVGFFKGGTYSYGCRLDPEAPFGPTLLPAYVAEIIRRETLGPKIVGENLEYVE